TMAQYLSKGKPVFIEGRLKMEEWEDKNGGGRRTKHVIVVDNFQFVDSGSGSGGSGAVGGGSGKPQINHDEIPF
ncbi:MAG: single-stranded DNA-binding protein, partial [Phycisphaerales bacterium]|nr:single-stranded DNA-binding protein [Phycisphaerales bacterium]